MKTILAFLSLSLLFTISCTKENEGNSGLIPFDSINRPYFTYNQDQNNYLLKPWDYDHPISTVNKYPLVIFLHGSGGAGNISYLNYIGYDNPEDDREDQTALKFQKNHPGFVLVPQTSSSWNNSILIEQVEELKNTYRIDESRIYLIGYSMGGSGSYSFANAYYDYNHHLFAGIIRLAGQSQTSVRNAIADSSAIWLHIGLTDTEQRVQVTRDAYNFLSNYHSNPPETITNVPIEGIQGKTYSLLLKGEDRFKRTEYEQVGHGIAALPFGDPQLIEWLFNQSLD